MAAIPPHDCYAKSSIPLLGSRTIERGGYCEFVAPQCPFYRPISDPMAAVPPLNCCPKARESLPESRKIGEDGCGGLMACRDVVDTFQKRSASRCQSCKQ
jgi:hypothetical protein